MKITISIRIEKGSHARILPLIDFYLNSDKELEAYMDGARVALSKLRNGIVESRS